MEGTRWVVAEWQPGEFDTLFHEYEEAYYMDALCALERLEDSLR